MRGDTLIVVLLLILFFFAAPSTADIRSDNRDLILFSKFKYSHSGYVSVSISSVGISSSTPATSNSSHEPDPLRTGFFLISQKLSNEYNLELYPPLKDSSIIPQGNFRNPNLCTLDIKNITLLFTFQTLSDQSSFNRSYNVTNPGLYSLYFANCNNQSFVTMDVRTELYSNDGITKNYLSADQLQPSLYFKFFLIYLCFLGFWFSLCVKNQQYVKMIHLIMYVLLFVTVFYYICAAADQQDLKVSGTHHQWRVWFYIFEFMRNLCLYTVVVLIASGWCFWKPVLLRWEIYILAIVILLRVWVNVSYIMVGEPEPYDDHWHRFIKDAISGIDMICYWVVLVYSLLMSCEFSSHTDTSTYVLSFIKETSETSARPYVLSLVSGCLMIPMLLVPALVKEISSLVFYMVMFYLYRPSVLDDYAENSKAFLV